MWYISYNNAKLSWNNTLFNDDIYTGTYLNKMIIQNSIVKIVFHPYLKSTKRQMLSMEDVVLTIVTSREAPMWILQVNDPALPFMLIIQLDNSMLTYVNHHYRWKGFRTHVSFHRFVLHLYASYKFSLLHLFHVFSISWLM